jgi:Na+-translocating ferredoxin:NAD+ oxidoreductase RnfG subunit
MALNARQIRRSPLSGATIAPRAVGSHTNWATSYETYAANFGNGRAVTPGYIFLA